MFDFSRRRPRRSRSAWSPWRPPRLRPRAARRGTSAYGYNQTDGISFKTNKNWTGHNYGRSYFNNAYAYEGQDHVNVKITSVGTRCYHYGPTEGKRQHPGPAELHPDHHRRHLAG
ncbi:hypothetical protein [Nonomuraea sp. LPB2021202275-12-8]|uniref:hypothetical protein n=1 Tax=Nonomuraea sp. LPB2021202275-12-8 TaxID=3120159 RepID=UPI00300CFCC0